MVLFADGAVSDNNQMMEFVYNNMQMTQIYCNDTNSSRCQYILKSNNKIYNEVYSLYYNDVVVFLSNFTAVSKLLYYESYQIPVNFTINGQGT